MRAIAIHPDDPDRIFAGTSAGQLWLSQDGGRTWAPAGADLPFPGWVVSAPALRSQPRRPRLWVALWGVWGSGHVAFSDDLGKTWVARAGGLPDEPVYTLALVPGREGHLYAGTRSGVWGTVDGGVTWTRLTGDLPEVQKVTSLLVDPTQPDTVFAGTWRRVYRSDDGGTTWAGVFEGMVLDSEVFSMTPIPERPGEIWATTCGWVYRTLDRGGHWERFKEGFVERRTPAFAALPGGKLLAGTVGGLHASTDGGTTWKRGGRPGAVDQRHRLPSRAARAGLPRHRGLGGLGLRRRRRDLPAVQRGDDQPAHLRPGGLRQRAAGRGEPRRSVLGRPRLSTTAAGRSSPVSSRCPTSSTSASTWAVSTRPPSAGSTSGAAPPGSACRSSARGASSEVAVDGERIAVRTPSGLWELAGGKFVPRAYKHGAPRSAAFFGGALWVSDAEAVYRLTETGERHGRRRRSRAGGWAACRTSSCSGAPAAPSSARTAARGDLLVRGDPRALARDRHRRSPLVGPDGERRHRPPLRPHGEQVRGAGGPVPRARHLRRRGGRQPAAPRDVGIWGDGGRLE